MHKKAARTRVCGHAFQVYSLPVAAGEMTTKNADYNAQKALKADGFETPTSPDEKVGWSIQRHT